MTLKSQDILILLYLITQPNGWIQADIAEALLLSPSEVSNAMRRCVLSGFMNTEKSRVNKLALREFLISGLKYAFPALVSTKVRGVATAHSATPIKEQISEGEDIYVWSYYLGTRRGYAVTPLYKTVPKIVKNNPALYELLVIVDTIRIGKVREVEIAIVELDKKLK
ncbi:MAG: hypothetical protein R3Y26_07505 [Rikenellaceae bacterium]